jgi:hypothetical protein
MDLTTANIADMMDGIVKTLTNDNDLAVPVQICRYNTPQEIDRIVLQIRGGLKVTIHTADAGQKA